MSKRRKELITQTELLIALSCLIIISVVAIIYNSMPNVFAGNQPAGQMQASATTTSQFACGTIALTGLCSNPVMYSGGTATCRDGYRFTMSQQFNNDNGNCITTSTWSARVGDVCSTSTRRVVGTRNYYLGSRCTASYSRATITCNNGRPGATRTYNPRTQGCFTINSVAVRNFASLTCGCQL